MNNSRWTQGLNPEQCEAVLHNEGPLLILAGAGSGKTTVLVSRTGRLIDEKVCAAKNLLVLTFTNKAARELKHRVAAKLGPLAEGLTAGTFHSFGLQLLKKHAEAAGLPARFSVIDTTDSAAILKELMKEVKIVGKDKFDVEKILSIVNDLRSGEARKTEAFDEYREIGEMLAPRYEKKLDLLGVVDFESLLLKPLRLMQEHPEILAATRRQYKHLMVDEFQDTNRLQMKLLHLLVEESQNLAVVGDDDQSIYGWRGAQISNILNFPKEFRSCRVVKLERNYRSSPAILNLANEVIAKNKTRHGKVLRPQGEDPGILPELFVLENEEEECEFVAREIRAAKEQGFHLREMAVLYRSNTQGGLIESALRKNQIEYSISGGTSIFDRKEAKDVLAYLRQAFSPNDVAFRRILNVPARGIGDTSLEKLILLSREKKLSFVEASRRWREAGLHDKAGAALEELLHEMKTLPHRILEGSTGTPGSRLLEYLIEIGYRQEVMASGSQPGAGEKKWQIVEIAARIFDHFLAKRSPTREAARDFLEAMTLRDEGEDEGPRNEVSLMTLHASKGLEFPMVILAGVEEDLLPHRSLGGDLDEERRLFYVGLTRAKKKLLLSRCRTRVRHGQQRPVTASRFLLDLPEGLFKEYSSGYRPVSGHEREALVSDFFAKLKNRSP